MEKLGPYLAERSEGVLRLLEGGKRRGLEELKKGKGQGSQKDLFQAVVASQHAFMELHESCRTALRLERSEDARNIAIDIQYLLYLFSRRVYELAFAGSEGIDSVSFPPPEAYSRHYPGEGPDSPAEREFFLSVFGDTTYLSEKSKPNYPHQIDPIRLERLLKMVHFPNLAGIDVGASKIAK